MSVPVVGVHKSEPGLNSDTADHQKYSGNTQEKFSSPFAFSEGSNTPAVSSTSGVGVYQTAGQQIPQVQYHVQQMPRVQVQGFVQQIPVGSEFGLNPPVQQMPHVQAQGFVQQVQVGSDFGFNPSGPLPPQQTYGAPPAQMMGGSPPPWQMISPQEQSFGQMPPQQGYGGPPAQMMAGPPQQWQGQADLMLEGWLSKRAEDFGNTWQNRWFMLYGGGVLTYGKSQDARGGAGEKKILLNRTTEIRHFRSNKATDEGQRCGIKKQFGFEIYSGPACRTWYLDPGSAEKRDLWIQALRRSIHEVGGPDPG